MRMHWPMALEVGWFLWRMPGLNEESLPIFLEKIARERAGRCAKTRRIARWRRRWLRLPGLKSRNTCYTRALVMFRFLEFEDGRGVLRFHLGTEPPRGVGDVPHGHAWVTVDGRELEPLPAEIRGRLRELYVYPPLVPAVERRAGVEG